MYSSNSDLVFSSTYSVPRLAQGSFVEAWQAVYKTCYGGPEIEVRWRSSDLFDFSGYDDQLTKAPPRPTTVALPILYTFNPTNKRTHTTR